MRIGKGLNLGQVKKPTVEEVKKQHAEDIELCAKIEMDAVKKAKDERQIPVEMAPEKKPMSGLSGMLAKAKTQKQAVANPTASLSDKLKESKDKPPPSPSKVQKETPVYKLSTKKYQILEELGEQLDSAVVEEFIENMQTILNTFESEALHDVMQKTLHFAQKHPELKPLLEPEDIQIFVDGARRSYAKVVVAKKGKKKKKAKRDEVVADFDEFLNDLEL